MEAKKKIEELKQRKAKIDEQLSALKKKDAAQERKDDTRLKVLIGAAMLADSKIRPKMALFIEEVLQRAVKDERSRAFLKSKGWLKTEPPKNGQ